jgi:hypothetical protein
MVTCRLLQNSYTVGPQNVQIATENYRYKLPRKQCKFTEEQVYAAMLKHEGARSLVAKELGCHVRTIDNYIERFPSLQDILHDRKVGICDHSEARARLDLLERMLTDKLLRPQQGDDSSISARDDRP